jgi:hypothetical protein
MEIHTSRVRPAQLFYSLVSLCLKQHSKPPWRHGSLWAASLSLRCLATSPKPNSFLCFFAGFDRVTKLETPGELCMQSPSICLGYMNNTKATVQTIVWGGYRQSVAFLTVSSMWERRVRMGGARWYRCCPHRLLVPMTIST